ncbi:hypothetical protein AC249_AIPGENE29097 [Exaiptasia diaphana]|nr:hypothetical protein AC249_AIPGENE29097 [Exaiptasia diaphana]
MSIRIRRPKKLNIEESAIQCTGECPTNILQRWEHQIQFQKQRDADTNLEDMNAESLIFWMVKFIQDGARRKRRSLSDERIADYMEFPLTYGQTREQKMYFPVTMTLYGSSLMYFRINPKALKS